MLEIDKLRKKRNKLKMQKDYVLSRIRKYDVKIQRAVVKNIWLDLIEIERQIDEITLRNANNDIKIGVDGLVSRSMPIGYMENMKNNNENIDFGIWRADNNSLIKSFGALRPDISAYIDDIALPGLFLGPFRYHGAEDNKDDSLYMVLIDEAGFWFNGDSKDIRLISDIMVNLDNLSLQKDINYDSIESKYIEMRDDIEQGLNNIIDAKSKLGDILQDSTGAYITYRKDFSEYLALKNNLNFSEQELKTIKKLRKRFNLRSERDII